MAGLLGIKISRQFKIYRSEFSAIFRFSGKLYMEVYDTVEDTTGWEEVDEAMALHFLEAKDLTRADQPDLTPEEQLLADKLEDCGLEKEQREDWVKDIVIRAEERAKR